MLVLTSVEGFLRAVIDNHARRTGTRIDLLTPLGTVIILPPLTGSSLSGVYATVGSFTCSSDVLQNLYLRVANDRRQFNIPFLGTPRGANDIVMETSTFSWRLRRHKDNSWSMVFAVRWLVSFQSEISQAIQQGKKAADQAYKRRVMRLQKQDAQARKSQEEQEQRHRRDQQASQLLGSQVKEATAWLVANPWTVNESGRKVVYGMGFLRMLEPIRPDIYKKFTQHSDEFDKLRLGEIKNGVFVPCKKA